jgi:hypothetical protein
MNSSDSFYLIDIINLINYNINSICEQREIGLITKHHKNAIMTVIKTLEKKKYFEYLYICILMITSRICEGIVKNYLIRPEDKIGGSNITKSSGDKFNERYFKRNNSVKHV